MGKKGKKSVQSLMAPWPIRLWLKTLGLISPQAMSRFATTLFTTPIRHKTPTRELQMLQNATQFQLQIPELGKAVVCYHYGNSDKKILLVHGWSGRGTQLAKIAEALLEKGYSTISFDAPAHGQSPGKTSVMTEFIACIQEIDRQFGPFEALIGHSLGGMSVLNAIRFGLQTKAACIIGAGDRVTDILLSFSKVIGQNPNLVPKIKDEFQKRYPTALPMEEYSGYVAAQNINLPVLLIHDLQDKEVPVSCSQNIHKHLKGSEILITQGLGHRKILGNSEVIQKCLEFIDRNS